MLHSSMINKNPETEIGVQPEDQKGKTFSYWLLSLPQSKWWSCLHESQWIFWLCEELSLPILYSSLWLKPCKIIVVFLLQTNVAIGIRVRCHHCLVCEYSCFTLWASDMFYLLKSKWNITAIHSINKCNTSLNNIQQHLY